MTPSRKTSTLRRALMTLVLAGPIVPATSAAQVIASSRPACVKTYTTPMFARAARATYRGTRTPTARNLRQLRKFFRCARHPRGKIADRRIWSRERRANAHRRALADATTCPPLRCSTASWFDDAGATASGRHYYYGVAHLTYAFGTRVEFCYPPGSHRCVVATVEDRGPYVGGREWDINQAVRDALGFDGVATVAWKIL